MRIPPPRRADRTLLPAGLSAVLALVFAAQFAVPSTVDLPDPPPARPFRLRAIGIAPLGLDPVVTARPLFAPTRRETTAEGVVSPAAALGGARFVGLVRAGARLRIFLQLPDGHVAVTAPGGTVLGWRIVAADATGLVAMRGTERATLTVGASTPPPKIGDPPAEPVEEEAP